MATIVATYEAVSAAAEAMIAEGLEPTTTAILRRVGGSFTTVAAQFAAWKSKRAGSEAVEVPAEIQARGDVLLREVYAHALRGAREAVAEAVERATAAIKAADAHAAEATAEVQRLEGIDAKQAEHIGHLEQRIKELELSAASQQATLQEKVAALARLEEQYAEAQTKLGATLDELAGLRASSKAAEAIHGQLETLQRSVQVLASANSK